MSGLHPTEEDLILYFYGEVGEGRAIRDHLATCVECGRRFGSWRDTLEAVVAEPVPERGEDYAARVWERLRPHLAAGEGSRPRAGLGRRLVLYAALAASLLAAFTLGRAVGPRGETSQTASVPARERILLVALGDHLERTQVVLLELVNADPAQPVDLSPERRAAVQLVAASRLYRQSARRAGRAGVASVLEDLERILVEIADGPDQLLPAQAEALRQRIESQGLLFKVRVLGERVEAEENRPPDRGRGGLDADLKG
jgi:hypothetical protein